jgi:hypothetical protein
MVVDFSSNFKGALPPCPKLLALHTTCAQVAHWSGAIEFFDELERNAEEAMVSPRTDSQLMSLCDPPPSYLAIPVTCVFVQ